jgi:hypothetical protein
MRRHIPLVLLALLLGAAIDTAVARAQTPPPPPSPYSYQWKYVGPTLMLFPPNADTTWDRRAAQWNTDSTNDYEKMLWTGLKMRFWRNHISDDQRLVFDTLGFPTGRILLAPVGHKEELWYYSQMAPPLRFVDGDLENPSQFETFQLLRHR